MTQKQVTNNFLGEDAALLENYKKAQTLFPLENKPLQQGLQQGLQERLFTTSLKYKEIAQAPIGHKTVEQLPGIGAITAKKMNDKGLKFAYQLLGIYLSINDSQAFKNYLKEEFAINSSYQNCINSVINEYLLNFYDNKNDKKLDYVTSFFLTHDLNLDLVRENFPTLNISQFEEIMFNLLG